MTGSASLKNIAASIAMGFIWLPVSVSAAPVVTEIRQKDVVDLLASTEVVYETAKGACFSLRISHFVGDGECESSRSCNKDKMIFITSTYDEYPERKAFEFSFDGAYRHIDVLQVPKNEKGKFLIRILSEVSGKRLCNQYVVGLNLPPVARACER